MDSSQLIDLEVCFQEGSTLTGTMSSQQLPRLSEVLTNPAKCIDFKMVFSVDEKGHRVIDCNINTQLSLVCQRCGDDMLLPVAVTSKLCVVANDSLAKKLPSTYEPFINSGEPVKMGEIIEEELLLAIPMIPRHDEVNCAAKS